MQSMTEKPQTSRFDVGDGVTHRKEKWDGEVIKVVGDPTTKNGCYAVRIDGRPDSYFVAQPASLRAKPKG